MTCLRLKTEGGLNRNEILKVGRGMKEEKPQWSNELLQFEYCNARGEITVRHLIAWSEVGHYIKGKGLGDTHPLTYRKDRVVRYIDASEGLLAVPHVKPPPRPSATSNKEDFPQILFTGFLAKRRSALEAMANGAGLRVVATVTQDLIYICGGPNAGPKKVERARAQNCWVLDEGQYLAFVETGELPDSSVDTLVDTRQPLEFEYRFQDGQCRSVKLVDWAEVGRYVEGSDTADGLRKFFRIDLIVAYHHDGACLLQHPIQPSPPSPKSQPLSTLQLRVIGYKTPTTNQKESKQIELEELAQAHQFQVVQSQTKNLTYLVCGPGHSPMVAKRAREAGCYLLNPDQLPSFAATGVLPDTQTPPRSEGLHIERLGLEYDRHFELWAFDIQIQHWPALGVSLGNFIEAGGAQADEVADGFESQAQTYQAWSRIHHWYDFHVGDVFYLRSDKSVYLQVADLSDSEILEIHQGVVGEAGSRRAYAAKDEQLAYWLRTGHRPDALQPVYQGNSKAGLLAWQVASS
jgi:hypothetical protein